MPDGDRRSGLASILIVVGVVVMTTGPLYRFRTWWDYEDPLAEDVPVVAVQALVSIAGVAVLATAGRWRQVDRAAGVLALALVAWLLVGSLWSLDSGRTAREALQIGATMAAGAAAATLVPARRLLWCLWAGVHIGLAWSAIAIAIEANGTLDGNGHWTGIFFNRNSLAIWAAMGLLLSLVLMAGGGWPALTPSERRRRADGDELLVLALAATADVFLLARTDALTPLVAIAAAVLAMVAGRAGRRFVRRGMAPVRLATIAGLVAAAVITALWVGRDRLVSLAGRDADLTGRSDLWAVSLDWVERRPVHGFGYLAAWQDREFLADVRERRGRILPSAHNSFVEVLLGGGLIALALLVALVVVLYLRAAVHALRATGTTGLWPLGLLAFVVVENLTETLLVGNHLTVAVFGVLMVAVAEPAPGSDPPTMPRARPDHAVEADSPGRR
jgi:O-antigen ligase